MTPKEVPNSTVRSSVVQKYGAAKIVIAEDSPRAHHPPDVCHPEKPVAILVIEAEPDFFRNLSQSARMRVNHSFGFPVVPEV